MWGTTVYQFLDFNINFYIFTGCLIFPQQSHVAEHDQSLSVQNDRLNGHDQKFVDQQILIDIHTGNIAEHYQILTDQVSVP